MNVWQASILGLIQGLTEFLPISSSAHLALAHTWLGWGDAASELPFDVALHLGTLVAVVAYFRSDLVRFVTGSVEAVRTRRANPESRMVVLLALGTLPAVIVGLLFKNTFERMHDWQPLMAATLAGVGLLLFTVDRRAQGTRTEPDLPRGLAIGAAQAIALVPGVSRSGITIAAGMMSGLTRKSAARFSFLLSIPAILGAVVLNAKDILAGDPKIMAAGAITAAVSGYFAIDFLLRHVTKVGFLPYAVYRILLAVVILAVWFTQTAAP